MRARGRGGEGAKGREGDNRSRPLAPSPPLLVLGLGQRARGDDAVGLLVVERLAALAPEGVTAREYSGDGAGLMDAWEGAGSVVLVDAVVSGAAPGSIHRFDARTPLPAAIEHRSTHMVGIPDAIELARLLGRLPDHLLVIGIEGRDFTLGVGPSPEVLAAVETVVRELAG